MSGTSINVRCLASTRCGQQEIGEGQGDGEAQGSEVVEGVENDGSEDEGDAVQSSSPSPSNISSSSSSPSSATQRLRNTHHTSCVQEAQLSPDGSCIFTSDYNRSFSVYPVSNDIGSQTSAQSLTPYASFPSPNPIWAFAANPLFNLQDANSTTVLVSRRDSYVTLHNALWDISRTYTHEENPPPAPRPVDISTPLASYKLINNLTEAVTAPISLTYSHDGAHFFGGSQDKIVIFDLQETNKPIHTIATIPARRNKLKGGGRGFKGYISALSLSPPSPSSRDGFLAAGSRTRHIGIYDPLSGAEVTSFGLPGTSSCAKSRNENLKDIIGDGVSSLKWSPCGNYLYVAERNADVLLIYDVRSFSLALGYCVGRKALTKQKLGFDVWNAGQSPYDVEGFSHEVWAGGTDGKVRVWRDAYAKEGAVLPDEVVSVGKDDEPVVASLVHPSGGLVVVASGVIRVKEEEEEQRGVQRGGGMRPRFREWGNLDILALG
ncbi:hypothetical protein GGP41_003964 [Bipolaris sorokiniana]|uniref:Uncharacterized protein n=2 Tax=Cochliobolus sativus TaxID=45130 RepID=A0A8H5ZN59_COCSA|nr:uncharacterized protein COCSADRAFT_39061 [Bipolaris sorokiniana ND90Pr]EMD61334.1 hypothetical protein COCSADRAFT_39061 [Bipolaris sorokiniana ND90Pr]KAF5851150.1 hypothetical protein GGP41_003964 [Bipolaris sorokiniana]